MTPAGCIIAPQVVDAAHDTQVQGEWSCQHRHCSHRYCSIAACGQLHAQYDTDHINRLSFCLFIEGHRCAVLQHPAKHDSMTGGCLEDKQKRAWQCCGLLCRLIMVLWETRHNTLFDV